MALKTIDKLDSILAVLEGANHDSPSRIAYEALIGDNLNIPLNAKAVSIGQSKLILYGKSPDFTFPDGFIKSKITKISGSWSLDSLFGIVFEMPRSITTKDGRFYLRETFFEPNWEYYFPIIETVLKDSKDIFKHRKTANELTLMNKRVF